MSEPEDFTPYVVGLCHASVCTCLSVEDAARRLNTGHPTGISSQWSLSDEKTFSDGKTPNGAPCHDHPETHKHYLFSC